MAMERAEMNAYERRERAERLTRPYLENNLQKTREMISEVKLSIVETEQALRELEQFVDYLTDRVSEAFDDLEEPEPEREDVRDGY